MAFKRSWVRLPSAPPIRSLRSLIDGADTSLGGRDGRRPSLGDDSLSAPGRYTTERWSLGGRVADMPSPFAAQGRRVADMLLPFAAQGRRVADMLLPFAAQDRRVADMPSPFAAQGRRVADMSHPFAAQTTPYTILGSRPGVVVRGYGERCVRLGEGVSGVRGMGELPRLDLVSLAAEPLTETLRIGEHPAVEALVVPPPTRSSISAAGAS